MNKKVISLNRKICTLLIISWISFIVSGYAVESGGKKIASALGVKDNPESPFYLPLNELKILNAADCSNVYVNWNCNSTDTEDGGLDANFNLVKDKIFSLNMHNLSDEWYP